MIKIEHNHVKRTVTILAAALLSAICVSAQDKLHSIEITTGYPSIVHFAEYPWAYRTVEMQWNGQTYKEHYQPGIPVEIQCNFQYGSTGGFIFIKFKAYIKH